MFMLARHVCGATIDAADGKFGKLCDLVFDDRSWEIRSLVIDAGTWLHSRRVTIPPDVIRHRDWADHRLLIAELTRQQVLDSPGAETHVPLVQQARIEEATIVDWGVYWVEMLPHPWQVSGDPHLHATHEVVGYHIQATDGSIGHVADFLIDDEAWKIHAMVIDTRNWWPGKHVLVTPDRIESIVGENRLVRLTLPRDEIRHGRELSSVV